MATKKKKPSDRATVGDLIRHQREVKGMLDTVERRAKEAYAEGFRDGCKGTRAASETGALVALGRAAKGMCKPCRAIVKGISL
jgi:hypothetical protein